MGKFEKGILGGFSGIVGPVVGATWRGVDILRSRPKRTQRVPTPAQLLQQEKFKLAVQFLQPLKSVQKLYFGADSGLRSRVNMAVSYTMTEAMKVLLDVPQLVYNKVLITKGELTGFRNLGVTNGGRHTLDLTWDDNSVEGNASPTDEVGMVVYSEEQGNWQIFENLAQRSAGMASAQLESYYSGQTVEVWVFVVNAKKKTACNSPYQGSMVIS